MKPRRFLIPTLIAAGFGSAQSGDATVSKLGVSGGDDSDGAKLFKTFKLQHQVQLAQHRSHSSHSSHSSHRSGSGGHYSHVSHTSHRSSTGGSGVYTPPVYSPPVYAPPSPVPTATRAPAAAPLPFKSFGSGRATAPQQEPVPSLSGRTARFKSIVRRVQIGLLAQGHYSGAIDGIVGPSLRGALRQFQGANRLPVTGTITSEVLDALRVSSD